MAGFFLNFFELARVRGSGPGPRGSGTGRVKGPVGRVYHGSKGQKGVPSRPKPVGPFSTGRARVYLGHGSGKGRARVGSRAGPPPGAVSML
jgi:hypothetical protein